MKVKIKLWKTECPDEVIEHNFTEIVKIDMEDDYLTFYTNCVRQMRVEFRVLVKVGLQAKLKYQHAGIYFDNMEMSITY